jgi:hypothetical protein
VVDSNHVADEISEELQRRMGKELQGAFEPYLLPLEIWLTPTGKEITPTDPHYMCSGFLVEIGPRWFWVTAGHVLDQIENDKHKGYWVSNCAFIEPRGAGRARVDVAYEPLKKVPIYEDRDIDVGWFEIPELQKKTLAAGGLSGIKPKNVAGWGEDFPGYAIVGIPAEGAATEFTGDAAHQSYALVVLPLKKLQIETAPSGWPRLIFQAQANGAVIEDTPLRSIVGMSGGLVVGLSNTDPIAIVAIGIQSAWEAATWKLKVSPLQPVVKYLQKLTSGEVAGTQ